MMYYPLNEIYIREYGLLDAYIISVFEIQITTILKDGVYVVECDKNFKRHYFPFLSDEEFDRTLLRLTKKTDCISITSFSTVNGESFFNVSLKSYEQYNDESKSISKPTHLYVCEKAGLYKIGKSIDPKGRISQLNTSSEIKINLLFVLQNLGHLERKIHNFFSGKRLNSEWFALNQTDLDYIKLHTIETI